MKVVGLKKQIKRDASHKIEGRFHRSRSRQIVRKKVYMENTGQTTRRTVYMETME